MPDGVTLGPAVARLRCIQIELDRQLQEACCQQTVAKLTGQEKDSPSALCSPPHPWTAYEFGAGTAAFNEASLTVTKGSGGGVVTIDGDLDARAHIRRDFASFLCDGLDAAAKNPPSVLMMYANCTFNSKMSATTHIRRDEPVSGAPTTVNAAHAISFADTSNEALWRIMLKSLLSNPCYVLFLKIPAGFIKRQPAYCDKFVGAFELKATRVCRYKLYNTPNRNVTSTLKNRMYWPPDTWHLSLLMCSNSSPCQPLLDNGTQKHQDVACETKAVLTAGFESEMALNLARVCFAGLSGSHLQST